MSTPPAILVTTLSLAGLLSGTALSALHMTTLPHIEAHKRAALAEAVLSVVPRAAHFAPVEEASQDASKVGEGDPAGAGVGGADGGLFATWDAQERFLGYAVMAEGPGFMDTIGLIYGYDPVTAKVVGLRILDSRETPGLGDKIMTDPGFVGSFTALSVRPEIVAQTRGPRAADNEVDCIAGATISSKAVIAVVQKSVLERDQALSVLKRVRPPAGSGKEVHHGS